ncbi:Ig-like domain-containing protein [Clostridium moutaii]|uniref:Ig-like domain-containing protein n=1 Tax=Clostridium moutaii TaxID=3240932 RepID=UPI00351004E2
MRKGRSFLFKLLKNILIFAVVILVYQLNYCNFVLADDSVLNSESQQYITQDNVPVDKKWTIKFNEPVDLSSAQASVKIIDKKTNGQVPIDISLSNNDSYVNVSPKEPYSSNSEYTLSVTDNLKSKYNRSLKSSFSMDFKTILQITNVNDLNVSISQGDNYVLPDIVTATMSDGSVKQVGVVWNKNINTEDSPGTYVYEGNVTGYDKPVNLNVTIKPSNKDVEAVASTSMWIWQLQSQVDAYGGIDNLIAKLKSMGINNVCIKYNEGSSPSGGGTNFRDDFLKYVGNFKQAGFIVGTWGYNYFNYPEDEANLIIEALNNSDYYVFDAEDAVSGKTQQAEQVCQIIRNKCPNAIIGYTSFPIASYHQDIPYSVFNEYCDFSAPQCYWGDMQWSVASCLNKMVQDYKTYGLDKPIYPIIQTYNVDYGDYSTYSGYDFKATGLWSLDNIGSTFMQFINDMGSKFSS